MKEQEYSDTKDLAKLEMVRDILRDLDGEYKQIDQARLLVCEVFGELLGNVNIEEVEEL